MRRHGHQVEVDTDQALGIGVPQASSDKSAPIASLRAKARKAEHISHQALKQRGDLLHVQATLIVEGRKTVARERRRHHREGIVRVATVARWISEWSDDVHEFVNRSGPA